MYLSLSTHPYKYISLSVNLFILYCLGVCPQVYRFIMSFWPIWQGFMRHRIIMRHYLEVQEKQDYHEFFHTSLQGYNELMINRWFSSGCLSRCFYPINVKSTDRAQIFLKTSCEPREGLWMIELLKINLSFYLNISTQIIYINNTR